MKKIYLFFLLLSFSQFSPAQITGGLLQEFTFNNTLSNTANTISFASGTGISFVADRNGVSNAAVNIVASGATGGTSAIITGLPGNKAARTVAFWVKFNNILTNNYVLDYGAASRNGGTFGFNIAASGATAQLKSYNANVDVATTTATNVWYHYAITYDGVNARIYKNGVLQKASIADLNTDLFGNQFFLGLNVAAAASGSLDASFDDLKIYNKALTADDVNILYNGLPTPLHEFSFDNTPYNNTGTSLFGLPSGSSYFTDGRKGDSLTGVKLNNQGANAGINDLPAGTSRRTITCWVKFDNLTTTGGISDFIFGYGATTGTGVAFGLSHYNNTLTHFGLNDDYSYLASPPLQTNRWYHMAIMWGYGAVQQIYLDGVNVNSSIKNWNTASSNGFTIGGFILNATRFNGVLDDLKIYGEALSPYQIALLAQANNDLPGITNISASNIAFNSATINYDVNAFSTSTSTIVKYGTSSSALTSQTTANITYGSSYTSANVTLNGLQENTVYYYQIESTNAMGTKLSAIKTFTTKSRGPIYEFRFNNSLSDVSNTVTFGTPTFGSNDFDRFGTINGAYKMTSGTSGSTATLANLPSGSSARSVSVWVKFYTLPTSGDFSYVFGYGGAANNSAYGLSAYGASGTSLYNYGYNNDMVYNPAGLVAGNWYHIVTVYDGTTAKLYLNGNLVLSSSKTWNTTASTTFYLGKSFGASTNFNGAVDDLKIFNYALTAADITSLYAYNTLPVVISNFKGVSKDADNILSWQTTSETNNKGFEIERSINGLTFEKVGFVASWGNHAQSYIFSDKNVTANKYYYRLKQIDNDGTSKYSSTIIIQRNKVVGFAIYPNPAKDFIYLQGNTDLIADFKLSNRLGQMFNLKLAGNQIYIKDLPKGAYMLTLKIKNAEDVHLRFIKQ